jgi:4,5-DOPA dioxygenase extradiol
MPALFVGHGSPMNALADNRSTQVWRQLGKTLPRPEAILMISAHWYVHGVAVTTDDAPETIYDFSGFPRALYEFRYAAQGDRRLADRVKDLLRPLDVKSDSRGLDHGAWSILAHFYPQADVPVVQLSIDRTQPQQFHYDIGRHLAVLRDEGILVMASGNVVHNLRMLNWAEPKSACDWALRFEQVVRDRLIERDHPALIDYLRLDRDAALAVPTPDHYVPLLYIAATQRDDEPVSFPVAGIEMGSLSMLSVVVGDAAGSAAG